MSNNEKIFIEFLNKHNIDYEYQYIINNVPFTKRGTHAVDFIIYNKDHTDKLYIEVKGFMTYHAVNILNYLLYHRLEYFYILQITEEDWFNVYDNNIYKSIKHKIENNINKHYELLLKFYNKEYDSLQLNKFSKSCLKKYLVCKDNEYKKWINNIYDKEAN